MIKDRLINNSDMKKIFLCAGHNGPGTGSVKLLDEGREAIRLRNAISKKLNIPYILDVDCNRLDDSFVNEINRQTDSESICIDIHFNSSVDPKVRGVEVFRAELCSARTVKLANSLLIAVANALEIPRQYVRGVKSERLSRWKSLAMCSKIKCPSVVLEVCYISNQEDVSLYNKNFDILVQELAEVINHFWE